MTGFSRRDFVSMIGASVLVPAFGTTGRRGISSGPGTHPFRIRTITAGVELSGASSLKAVESALAVLGRAKSVLTGEGYEVQTIRVTTSPFVAGLSPAGRQSALKDLKVLDQMVDAHGAIASIGPLMETDQDDAALAEWLVELVSTTRQVHSSIVVASPEGEVHYRSARTAGRVMMALAGHTERGLGNFRFAAAANMPAGTPFFPVGYHRGPSSIALGLETPSLIQAAVERLEDRSGATRAITEVLNEALVPLERTMVGLARREGLRYLGIDTSPAPGRDRSIGEALEKLIKAPFGSSSTLAGCAMVTAALQSVAVRTIGYCGLMLPVLEDPVLARRADEGRYGIQELLLFSSVCGTGLDVVPIPGDTPVELVSNIILDVAALSARWKKPLSARLLPVPGKSAGDTVTFEDRWLNSCKVFSVG
jgi:uncharacterized protein (UPF0210 family)